MVIVHFELIVSQYRAELHRAWTIGTVCKEEERDRGVCNKLDRRSTNYSSTAYCQCARTALGIILYSYSYEMCVAAYQSP